MRRIYLDMIGLLALWNARDQWHEQAVRVLRELTAAGVEFWTSEYVLLECGYAAARTPFRDQVVELRRNLLEDGKVLHPEEGELNAAWETYQRGSAGEAGIVDLVSFAVMRRMRITEAVTNDRHFQTAGFVTLL